MYHSAEGGAIASDHAPPPGVDEPYPNLASVPVTPVPTSSAQQQVVAQRLNPAAIAAPVANMQANTAALAGLELPSAPPPAADIAGISEPASPTPHVILPPAPPPSPPALQTKDSAPVAVAFAPGSAILRSDMVRALSAMALARGQANVLAGGFGEGALSLGLQRAQAVANALTAAGVPAKNVILTAAAGGAGGFAQLVY